MSIRAVFFDIGETLINETRSWSLLADWLGVPRMTMFGILGGLIAERRDHRELFEIVRPDIGWRGVVEGFQQSGMHRFLPEDLYPDVVESLTTLRKRGYFVGIAGNQPIQQEAELRAMNLPTDLLATSAGWGVQKPDPEFYARVVREAGCRADEIAYVGDRVDNDVIPAANAGLVPVHLVRGPWGYLQRDWPEASRAKAQIQSLHDLAGTIERW